MSFRISPSESTVSPPESTEHRPVALDLLITDPLGINDDSGNGRGGSGGGGSGGGGGGTCARERDADGRRAQLSSLSIN